MLDGAHDLPLQVIRSEENLGGAGGFHLGVRAAYDAGWDRIWLMDDDVVPAPDCLERADGRRPSADCLMAVREDLAGRLVEKAAIDVRPAQPAGDQAQDGDRGDDVRHPRRDAGAGGDARTSPSRASWSAARWSTAIGLPDPAFFIFYDDVDFALRARRAGFRIWAVRDAVLVRQLDFDQQHDLAGGRATTCTATSSSCTSATARTRWSAPSRG